MPVVFIPQAVGGAAEHEAFLAKLHAEVDAMFSSLRTAKAAQADAQVSAELTRATTELAKVWMDASAGRSVTLTTYHARNHRADIVAQTADFLTYGSLYHVDVPGL